MIFFFHESRASSFYTNLLPSGFNSRSDTHITDCLSVPSIMAQLLPNFRLGTKKVYLLVVPQTSHS